MAFPAVLVWEDLHWKDWGDLLKDISQASTQVEQKLESRQDKIELCAPTDMCQEEDIRQSSSASSVRNQCTAPPASNGTTP